MPQDGTKRDKTVHLRQIIIAMDKKFKSYFIQLLIEKGRGKGTLREDPSESFKD